MKNRSAAAWALLKTAIFTIVVPGMVGVLIPAWLLSNAGIPDVLPPLSWHWIGVLPLLGGACVYFWCAWDFAVKGLGTPAPIDMPRKLVADGLYRFVRNPMYVGVGCVILGQAILFGSRAVLIYGVGFWMLANLFVIFCEEPTLRRKFGAEYEEYVQRVPRWLPRPPG